MEEEQYILLMDEPEISLHIGWQQRLIDIIRELNPNCQLIIATHSPSIFGEGWGDKLFFVEDLFI
jgi:predicted ATP-dependent endonuclease of OLD family